MVVLISVGTLTHVPVTVNFRFFSQWQGSQANKPPMSITAIYGLCGNYRVTQKSSTKRNQRRHAVLQGCVCVCMSPVFHHGVPPREARISERSDLARIINKAKVKQLLTRAGAVCGVTYEKKGKDFTEEGPVILATGGFGADFTDDVGSAVQWVSPCKVGGPYCLRCVVEVVSIRGGRRKEHERTYIFVDFRRFSHKSQ